MISSEEEPKGDSHVMMLAQVTEILVQLLHALLVRLDAFSLHPVVELDESQC